MWINMKRDTIEIEDLSGGLYTNLEPWKIKDNCLAEVENAVFEKGLLRSKRNAKLLLTLPLVDDIENEEYYYYDAIDGLPGDNWLLTGDTGSDVCLVNNILAFFNLHTTDTYYQKSFSTNNIVLDVICNPSACNVDNTTILGQVPTTNYGYVSIVDNADNEYHLRVSAFNNRGSHPSADELIFRAVLYKVTSGEPVFKFHEVDKFEGWLGCDDDKRRFELTQFRIRASNGAKIQVYLVQGAEETLIMESADNLGNDIKTLKFGARGYGQYGRIFSLLGLHYCKTSAGTVNPIGNMLALHKHNGDYFAHGGQFLYKFDIKGKAKYHRGDMNQYTPSKSVIYLDKMYITTNIEGVKRLAVYDGENWTTITGSINWLQLTDKRRYVVGDCLILHRDRLFIATRGDNTVYHSELFTPEGNAIQPDAEKAWYDSEIQMFQVPLNLINIVSLEDRVVILCNNQFYVLYTADNNSVNWRLIEGVQDMGDIEGDSVCKVSGGFIFQSETGIYFSNGIEKKRLFPQVQDIIDESWSKETKWAGMYPNILNYGENLLLSLPMKVTKTYLEEATEEQIAGKTYLLPAYTTEFLQKGILKRTREDFLTKYMDVPISCMLLHSNNPHEANLIVGSRLSPKIYLYEAPEGDVPFVFRAVTKEYLYSGTDKYLETLTITADGDGDTYLRIYYSYGDNIFHFLRTVCPPVQNLKISPHGWDKRGKSIQLKLVADISDWTHWIAINKIEIDHIERLAL